LFLTPAPHGAHLHHQPHHHLFGFENYYRCFNHLQVRRSRSFQLDNVNELKRGREDIEQGAIIPYGAPDIIPSAEKPAKKKKAFARKSTFNKKLQATEKKSKAARAAVTKTARLHTVPAPKKNSRAKNPAGTPLQRFKAQTISKRNELKKARRDIDKELKAIEKDLGTLKRSKK
jgi:hypothetical protein